MNASITDIARDHFAIARRYNYRVNKQGEYRTQVLQIFLTIKTPSSGRHATAYTVNVAVPTFKVIQGQ